MLPRECIICNKKIKKIDNGLSYPLSIFYSPLLFNIKHKCLILNNSILKEMLTKDKGEC